MGAPPIADLDEFPRDISASGWARRRRRPRNAGFRSAANRGSRCPAADHGVAPVDAAREQCHALVAVAGPCTRRQAEGEGSRWVSSSSGADAKPAVGGGRWRSIWSRRRRRSDEAGRPRCVGLRQGDGEDHALADVLESGERRCHGLTVRSGRAVHHLGEWTPGAPRDRRSRLPSAAIVPGAEGERGDVACADGAPG